MMLMNNIEVVNIIRICLLFNRLDITNKSGNTPLHSSLNSHSNKDVVQTLLQAILGKRQELPVSIKFYQYLDFKRFKTPKKDSHEYMNVDM